MLKKDGNGCLSATNLTLKNGFCDNTRSPEDISRDWNIPLDTLFFMKQTHSNNIVIASEDTFLKEADAVIDTSGKYVLAVKTADCLPILIQSESGSLKAVLHASWKTILSGIIEKTVEKIRELTQEGLFAAFGPCLQEENFEVKEDMSGRFPETVRKDKEVFIRRDEKIFFNAPRLAEKKLLALGIKPDLTCCIDTYGDRKYYSYRRGTHEGRIETGRQWSWI